MSRVHAVVTAAGSSSRMGGVDKLLLPLDGEPLLVRTLQPFLTFPQLGRVVVAVNPERVEEFTSLFDRHYPGAGVLVTAGGAHRQQSILYALRAMAAHTDENDTVMIHDGARPFVTHRLFQSLLERLADFDGVIPALPVRDTIKRVEGSRVLKTEDRETLRQVQTPQIFEFNPILRLHERAAEEKFLGTDDASLLERYGMSVGWVEGPIHNLKVTVPEDVELLNHLFSRATQ
ncbi:MAG: 2-C-methyl-D-erythritol 4-phosphate cytidylyltransferase [Candidatus Eremiobacteraeota bacterium]|nr:2-C-methyl-D-erythritol 4-phosphate cytidylyltransferase [Candidatus Eremiobacteraeota bacterium]